MGVRSKLGCSSRGLCLRVWLLQELVCKKLDVFEEVFSFKGQTLVHYEGLGVDPHELCVCNKQIEHSHKAHHLQPKNGLKPLEFAQYTSK